MITKFTWEDFYSSKVNQKFELVCEFCGNSFYLTKNRIQSAMKHIKENKKGDKAGFCSKSCASKSKIKKVELDCLMCKRKFIRSLLVNKKPSRATFCSKSCSARYNYLQLNIIS